MECTRDTESAYFPPRTALNEPLTFIVDRPFAMPFHDPLNMFPLRPAGERPGHPRGQGLVVESLVGRRTRHGALRLTALGIVRASQSGVRYSSAFGAVTSLEYTGDGCGFHGEHRLATRAAGECAGELIRDRESGLLDDHSKTTTVLGLVTQAGSRSPVNENIGVAGDYREGIRSAAGSVNPGIADSGDGLAVDLDRGTAGRDRAQDVMWATRASVHIPSAECLVAECGEVVRLDRLDGELLLVGLQTNSYTQLDGVRSFAGEGGVADRAGHRAEDAAPRPLDLLRKILAVFRSRIQDCLGAKGPSRGEDLGAPADGIGELDIYRVGRQDRAGRSENHNQ